MSEGSTSDVPCFVLERGSSEDMIRKKNDGRAVNYRKHEVCLKEIDFGILDDVISFSLFLLVGQQV